jgi:hypothetical protein
MEQLNNQRDMTDIWEGSDRHYSRYPELDPQSMHYREPSQPWEESDTDSDAERGESQSGYVEVVDVQNLPTEAQDYHHTIPDLYQNFYHLGQEETELLDTYSGVGLLDGLDALVFN